MEIECFDKIKFEKAQKSGKTCILQFWSAWCGDCFDLEPLKKVQSSKVSVFRVNFEDNEKLAQSYSIKITPSYVFFRNFKSIATLLGSQTENSLRSYL